MNNSDELKKQLDDELDIGVVKYVNAFPEIIDINKRLEDDSLSEQEVVGLYIEAFRFILKLQEDNKIPMVDACYMITGFLSRIEQAKMPEILDSIFDISGALEIPYHHYYESKELAWDDFLKLKGIINSYKPEEK
ncbi:MAG: hypothetical protein ACYDBX_02110 [Patescibacteria group bacterium]